MTKEELITNQQLEIEKQKSIRESNKKLLRDLHMKFYTISAPLNDNVLQFNRQQQQWCFSVIELIKQIDMEYEDGDAE